MPRLTILYHSSFLMQRLLNAATDPLPAVGDWPIEVRHLVPRSVRGELLERIKTEAPFMKEWLDPEGGLHPRAKPGRSPGAAPRLDLIDAVMGSLRSREVRLSETAPCKLSPASAEMLTGTARGLLFKAAREANVRGARIVFVAAAGNEEARRINALAEQLRTQERLQIFTFESADELYERLKLHGEAAAQRREKFSRAAKSLALMIPLAWLSKYRLLPLLLFVFWQSLSAWFRYAMAMKTGSPSPPRTFLLWIPTLAWTLFSPWCAGSAYRLWRVGYPLVILLCALGEWMLIVACSKRERELWGRLEERRSRASEKPNEEPRAGAKRLFQGRAAEMRLLLDLEAAMTPDKPVFTALMPKIEEHLRAYEAAAARVDGRAVHQHARHLRELIASEEGRKGLSDATQRALRQCAP